MTRLSSRGILPWAIGLYVLWLLSTYALEGLPRTLTRSEGDGGRLIYALFANIVVALFGAGLLVSAFVRRAHIDPQRLGLRNARRISASILLGFLLGAGLYMLQEPESLGPIVLLNAFAQVWVVSAAEVLLCWMVLGKAIQISLTRTISGRRAAVAAWVGSAVAFGVYHFAHSPPFNTVQMVSFLTVIGLLTGAYFWLIGELYGTIIFHNFLALQGVTRALAESGRLDALETLQVPLIMTALVATGGVVVLDLLIRKVSRRGTRLHSASIGGDSRTDS